MKTILATIQPSVVTQSIRIRVNQLFEKFRRILEGVEIDIMQKIKQSEVLQEFLQSSERL